MHTHPGRNTVLLSMARSSFNALSLLLSLLGSVASAEDKAPPPPKDPDPPYKPSTIDGTF